MPRVTLGDIELHYERPAPERGGASSGRPPLLLLAGMASDSASWAPIAPVLAERFDTIAPDNRCTGRTRPMPVATSREAMVGDALALLDALGIERVAVLGHSMGAMLGWALAAAAPERVTRLVACAATPEIPRARAELFASLARLRSGGADEAEWFRLLFQFLFSPSLFEDPEAVDAAVAGALAYPHRQGADAFAVQADALAGFVEARDLSAVACPVLAVAAGRDWLARPEAVAARHAADRNVRVATLPEAAHALHWEDPEGLLALAVPFLEGDDAVGGWPGEPPSR